MTSTISNYYLRKKMESRDVGKLEQFLYHNYTYVHYRELASKRVSDIYTCNKCQVCVVCFVEKWKFIPYRKQIGIVNDDFWGSRFEAYALFSINNIDHIFCPLGKLNKGQHCNKSSTMVIGQIIPAAFCSVYSQLIRRNKSSTIVMEQTNKLFTCYT